MSASAPVHSGQIVLTIVGGCFIPNGHSVAAYITKKFKERQCASGVTWRHVEQEIKDFYFHEFLKRYTCDPENEIEFKATWNAYCQKLYKDLIYKWRKTCTAKPSYISEDIWVAWQNIWAEEKWQKKSAAAQNNRLANVGGAGSSKHTAGSRSMVEHAIELEKTLQKPGTCWDVFRKTHKKKDGTFIDEKSKAIDDDITDRVTQASQPTIEGGDVQTLSDEAINDIYYNVVGGSKKNALYGLGSHARVAYDREMAPRAKGRPSSSSTGMQELRQENQALRDRVSAVEASIDDRVRAAVEQSERSMDDRVRAAVERQMREFFDRYSVMSPSAFPTPHRFDSQDTQDPNHPNN